MVATGLQVGKIGQIREGGGKERRPFSWNHEYDEEDVRGRRWEYEANYR